jgi:hypothetical protein
MRGQSFRGGGGFRGHAERGGGWGEGGGHFDRGRGWDHDRYRGGGGLYFGYGAPYYYGYGSGYYDPACGFYDRWGYWHPYPGCYADPYPY